MTSVGDSFGHLRDHFTERVEPVFFFVFFLKIGLDFYNLQNLGFVGSNDFLTLAF